MKGYAMLRIGEAGWIEKEDPKCGPMDAICRPIALAPCSSDIHTVYEGGVGERHNMMLGHEAVGEVVEVGSMVEDFKVGDHVIIPAITPDWSSVAAQETYAMHSGVPLGGWKFFNIKGRRLRRTDPRQRRRRQPGPPAGGDLPRGRRDAIRHHHHRASRG